MDVGAILKQLREDNGLTQIELASKIDVHTVTIRKWEAGERIPKTIHLKKLSDLFKVDISYFLQSKENVIRPSFAEIVRNKRIAKGLTQQQLGAMLNINEANISKYESGAQLPRWGTAERILNVLDNYKEISDENYVKKIRETAELTQEELGKLMGLSKSGISNLESGKRKINERHIKLINSALGINKPFQEEPETRNSISAALLQISKGFEMLADALNE